jgi:hypothetical protein
MSIFKKKTQIKTERKTYDREHEQPVLRCSICTGEQVAGFRDLTTGKFHDIMLIQNPQDLEKFMKTYDIETITRVY